MGKAPFDTDILIVGAGPVGLFLANECARRGLRWRLVESYPDIVELRLSQQPGLTLIRPDGYIAYGRHDDVGAAALTSVRSLLDRQIR